MDLITVIIIGIVVAATGVINPKDKDPEEVAKAPETQITTPEVKEPEPEPEPEPGQNLSQSQNQQKNLSQNQNQNQNQNLKKSLKKK